MKKIIFYSIYTVLLVIFLFSIVFDAVPISAKIILEAVGLVACIKYFFDRRYRLKKEYHIVIRLIIALVLWDVFTSFLNGRTEFHYIHDMIPILGSIFGGQLLFSYSRKYFTSHDQFLLILTIIIFGESVLALMMKAFPALYAFIDSFIVFDFGSDTIEDIFDLTRIFGLGNAHYFGVLPTCNLAVMAAVLLIGRKEKIWIKVLLLFMWIVISFTSFLTARWSIFLVGLSVGLYILLQKGKSISSQIGLVLVLVVLVIGFFTFATNNIDSESQEWAFAYFVDRDSSDHSADIVMGWWENTRFELKTFILGDAQYMDPKGGYYKHVDVGFFREIFYGGIIGLFIILFSHIKILKLIYRYERKRDFRLFLTFIFLGYLAAMAKGNFTMMSFLILFLVYYSDGIFEIIPRKA